MSISGYTSMDIGATLGDGSEANLATLFPDNSERVFAHWYSGELYAGRGELLAYVSMAYFGMREEDLIFTIEKGFVMANGVSSDIEKD